MRFAQRNSDESTDSEGTTAALGHDDTWLADPTLRTWAPPLALLLTALAAYLIVRRIVLPVASRVAERSRATWDDVLLRHRVLARLAPIAPLVVIGRGIGLVAGLDPQLVHFVERLTLALVVFVVVRTLGALLTAVNELYSGTPHAQSRPIKGYLQGLKIILYSGAAIVLIATLLDQSPWLLLSGLGAATAVLLLIFRDTLLSLVAGIQLTVNDLIRVGDWIEMPQFDADGHVVDISLNVVKVQNWDRTVTVIPAHKFLEHSFKNWRAMFESGGRRIKRSLRIDMSSIRFLDADDIARLSRIVLLRDYLQSKVSEIDAYNRAHVPADAADELANGRRLTNIGTFRAYIEQYLRHHPGIHQGIIKVVRQLRPTHEGLPIEIYAYTSETGWIAHEGIQADIFDHLLAVAPEFGLRVFQAPSGADVARIAGPRT
ncbi:MAG TPA: mechanosensitive ion channel family protein [Nannocystis sp.]